RAPRRRSAASRVQRPGPVPAHLEFKEDPLPMHRKLTPNRLLATAAVLILGAAGIGYSAFSSTASSSGNTFATGTVALSSNGSGGGALSITNGRPGDSTAACYPVAHTGSRDASVRFYALTSTTGND